MMKNPVSFKSLLLALFTMISGMAATLEARQGVLTGTVTSPAGEDLPGVHVTIPEFNFGTVTANNGVYSLSDVPSGLHEIHFSMVGFEEKIDTVRIQPDRVNRLDVVLRPAVYQSDALVVTASRRRQLVGEVSVSVHTISPEEITARNVLSLDQALDVVPGVQVLGNSVNVRGSSGFSYGVGSRVLLLVDGVPLMGPDDGGMDFDGLPLLQTRQIEILKSPGSALYGGGALGGVINIITKDFSETPDTRLRFYGGAFEPVRHSEWRDGWSRASDYRTMGGLQFARSHQVSDRFGYWISGTLRDNLGYLRDNRQRGFEGYTKLGWNVTDRLSMTLYTGIRRNRSQQFLYWNGLDDVLSPGEINLTDEPATGGNEGLSDRLSILPVLRYDPTENLQLTFKGRFFGVAFRPIDSEGNVRPPDRHNKGLRGGGEVQADLLLGEEWYLTAGGSFDANVVNSDVFFGEDSLRVRNQPEGAVFSQLEYSPGRRTTITAGLRYDAYKVHTLETATQLSPKLSASYHLSDFITARASFGRGFRVPSVAERFVNNSDFFPLESNIGLKPETSTGYEAGLTYNRPLFRGWNLKTELTGFWNEYRRLVEPQFIPELSAFQFINLTRARIRGAELLIGIQSLEKQHNLQVGYTFLDPEDLDAGRPLLYRSRHLLQVNGSLQVTSRLLAGFDFRASDAPERVDTDFSLFVENADLFPVQYVANARISYRFNRTESNVGFSASVVVNNLFDYYYVERPAILAPPRHGQVVLEFSF